MGKRRTPIDWKTYNKQLVNRGRNLANEIKTIKTQVVEFWDEELERMNEGKVGRKFEYPNSMIILFLVLKSALNSLSYRNLEGFGYLFFNRVPDYTRINRRIRQLDLDVLRRVNREVTKARTKGRRLELSLDGTGVQINGKYVWYDKKHKKGKMRKRDWKKLHIAIDTETKQILGVKILGRDENEGSHENTVEIMEDVLKNIDDTSGIDRVYGDGAYDNYDNFEFFDFLGIEPVIRIMRKSREIARFMAIICRNKSMKKRHFRKKRNRVALEQCDWEKYVEEGGYGKRSGLEGVIGSLKRFFREQCFSRVDDMIEREIMTKVLIWNVMM